MPKIPGLDCIQVSMDINGNWTLGCIGHPLQLSLRMSETTFAPAALDLDIDTFLLA